MLTPGKDVLITYHSGYYDGIISGHCWFNHEYCYFMQTDEKRFKYKLNHEEIEEIKKVYHEEDYEFREGNDDWDWTSFRIYTVYPYKTEQDAITALANRAVWENYVGFQNSYGGDLTPRFGEDRYKSPNSNDWKFWPGDVRDFSFFNSLPYKDINPEWNKNIVLGKFKLYDETEELIKEGRELIEV